MHSPGNLEKGTVTDLGLTQADADALLAMEKHRLDDTVYDYPSLAGC